MKSSAFLVALILTVVPSVAMAGEVNLFGYWTSPEDYVVGRVTGVVGQQVNISLGYIHGVVQGNHFLVLRRTGDKIEHIGWLATKSVHRSRTLAYRESDIPVKTDDIVLILAEDLLIWDPISRVDDEIIRRSVSQKEKNGYENLSRKVDGKDILREIQAERQKKTEYWTQELTRSRPYYQQQKLMESKLEETMAPELLLELPSERDWFITIVKEVQGSGFLVIPSKKSGVVVREGDTSVLKMINTLWKQAG